VPKVKVDDTLEMFYELDNFSKPWQKPETILLVHGIGGCTTEWFEWMPLLSAKYQVLRVDLRGWGKSTIPPKDYKFLLENDARDLKNLLDKLGIDKVHFVGTKLGGRIALHFANHYPERLLSVTLSSTPMTLSTLPGVDRGGRPSASIDQAGVARWARESMRERIGDVEPERMEWWVNLYASSAPHCVGGVFELAWETNESSLLPGIKAPTLVIDSDAQWSFDHIRQWQTKIPNSRLHPIHLGQNVGRQLTASRPVECATAVLEFIDGLKGK
jgi:pimeloyl-ACP methyl ester carboxylesterase